MSGVAELVCAAGLLARRRWAGPASVAVLLAVWPGNFQMALDVTRTAEPGDGVKVAGGVGSAAAADPDDVGGDAGPRLSGQSAVAVPDARERSTSGASRPARPARLARPSRPATSTVAAMTTTSPAAAGPHATPAATAATASCTTITTWRTGGPEPVEAAVEGVRGGPGW